jgi:hypothetical protein
MGCSGAPRLSTFNRKARRVRYPSPDAHGRLDPSGGPDWRLSFTFTLLFPK